MFFYSLVNKNGTVGNPVQILHNVREFLGFCKIRVEKVPYTCREKCQFSKLILFWNSWKWTKKMSKNRFSEKRLENSVTCDHNFFLASGGRKYFFHFVMIIFFGHFFLPRHFAIFLRFLWSKLRLFANLSQRE